MYATESGSIPPHLQNAFYTDTIDEGDNMVLFLAILYLLVAGIIGACIGGFIGKIVSILLSPFIKRSLKKRDML
jgi:hypothetical protein